MGPQSQTQLSDKAHTLPMGIGLDYTAILPLLPSSLWFLLYIFCCRTIFSVRFCFFFLIYRCSRNSCNFCVSMSGDELRMFLLCHLAQFHLIWAKSLSPGYQLLLMHSYLTTISSLSLWSPLSLSAWFILVLPGGPSLSSSFLSTCSLHHPED